MQWHKLDHDSIKVGYTKTSDEYITELNISAGEIKDHKDIDNIVEQLTGALLKAAKDTVPHANRKGGRKLFWCKNLTDLAAKKRLAYDEWVKAKRPKEENNAIFNKHKEAKINFRKEYRRAKYQYMMEIEEKIERNVDLDQKQFWYILNGGKKGPIHGNILKNDNGIITSEPNEVKQLWYEHFSELAQPSKEEEYDNDFEQMVTNELKVMDESKTRGHYDEVVEAPVMEEEIRDICKDLKLGKATGCDSLQHEHLRYAGPAVYVIIAMLFNTIMQMEYIPKSFRKSVNIPLFKGGDKDNMDRNNFRGISLQGILCKVYDCMILKRSKDIFMKCFNMSKYQAACLNGISSLHSSFMLNEMVSHSVENGSRVIVTYFDTRKAFDTVWIEGLFYQLYKKGIQG